MKKLYIKRALLSVYDKTDIIDFAKALSQRGIEIFSTNGTARILLNAGLPIIKITDYTGFPEIINGRIKTIHPKIHGGILNRKGLDDSILRKYSIQPIDLVVVNLYPFTKKVSDFNSSLEKIIENIDIGGSTLIRSAAKNYNNITIIVNYNDYISIIKEIDKNGFLFLTTRFHFSIKAFEYTAIYDGMIANYFGTLVPAYYGNIEKKSGYFPRTLNLNYIKKQDIRYGENPHQKAAFYIEQNNKEASISTAKQLQGKKLSYNNIYDIDSALECVKEFIDPACVIVKHSNPCGVAMDTNILSAYVRAYKTDPTSAFGGIIAFNRTLDVDTAQTIINRQFVEVIIAPKIHKKAYILLKNKKNIRVLFCGNWNKRIANFDFQKVNGGLLVQERNLIIMKKNQLHIVTKRIPTNLELQDAIFSWKVAKFVKSNVIIYARDNMTIGIGAGQMSRIYAAKIARIKANDEKLIIKNSVMASDAFFPFRDSIDEAAVTGVSCIIQPGGSIRDNEIINAANEHNISMIFTKIRHFRH